MVGFQQVYSRQFKIKIVPVDNGSDCARLYGRKFYLELKVSSDKNQKNILEVSTIFSAIE